VLTTSWFSILFECPILRNEISEIDCTPVIFSYS